MIETSTVLLARHGCAGLAETLPGFTVAFFTHGEHLVPVVRDILEPAGIIVSPGWVWSEPGDEGMSRASFPFVVTSPYLGEAHNGLATFLYDDTRVSALRFQVVQETSPTLKYDGWGQASLTYPPGPIANAEALMMGYGGNIVVLLPNGISAFRFADGHNYDVDTMVLAGEALRPFSCPAGSAAASPPVRQPLTASTLRAEVPDHTFSRDPVNIFPAVFGGRFTMFVSADGVLYGRFKGGPAASTEDEIGRWHITPEGQFCRTWHAWDNRRERCYTVYREGEHFALAMPDRFGKEVYTRMPGNPEGY